MKKVIAIALLSSLATGCAFTGTKDVDLFGVVKWSNFAGQKVYAGYENIDELDETRRVGRNKNPSFNASTGSKPNNQERY